MKIEVSNSPIRNAKISHVGGSEGSVTFNLFPAEKKNYYEITLTRAQLAELSDVFEREDAEEKEWINKAETTWGGFRN
jgi:hypothetical protein